MKQFRNMLYPYVVWLFIMVLVPMLMILLYAFTTAGNEVTTFRFTLDNFSRFLTDTVFLDVLKRSLLIAVVTTATPSPIRLPRGLNAAASSGLC